MPIPSSRIDQKERETAKRVRLVRFHNQLSKPAFAKSVGVSLDRIAGIEYARTPLTVSIADKISATFDISLVWLAHGNGRMMPSVGLISQICPEIKGSELLSRAVTPEFETKCRNEYKFGLFSMFTILAGESVIKTDDEAQAFANNFHRAFDDLFSNLPQPGKGKLLALLVRTLAKFSKDWEMENYKNPGENITLTPGAEKNNLTVVTAGDNNANVKAKLPALLKRLNKATRERGSKTQLAKFMGVPLPNVSQWLSGEREPSGENTLWLLTWVEQQERQK